MSDHLFQCQTCLKIIDTAHIKDNMDHPCNPSWVFVPARGLPNSPANLSSHICDACGAFFPVTSNRRVICPSCDNTKTFTMLDPVNL